MRINPTMVFTLAAAAIAAVPVRAAGPLTPIKPWDVDYQPTTCSADREYGDTAKPVDLDLIPSAVGNTYELLVADKGSGPRYAEELEGSVDFGQGPIKAWLLHYGTPKPPLLNFYKFRISKDEMAQAKTAQTVTFHIKGGRDYSFTLEVIPQLLSKLDDCTRDLRNFWNMGDAEKKNIATLARGDVRAIFSPADYPSDAVARGQEGTVQFLLFVDVNGSIARCDVLKPSGIPVLDGMGCQVIRQRAKFKPALGVDGKPARSTVVTPPVKWVIP